MPENKKSIEEFARGIKEKYPQYKDMDDVELANKMAEKYPQYKETVNFSVKKKNFFRITYSRFTRSCRAFSAEWRKG